MNGLKILEWDIETSYAKAAVFGLFEDRIPHKNIIQDWHIICAAYKYLGEKRVYGVSVLDDIKRFESNPNDDLHVVRHLHKVLSEADAIIHHNGDAFDIKKFNARAIKHGLPPLPPIVQIDTLKMARSAFKFTSNRLDYLGDYLGVGRKINTSPGLWLECLAGRKSAIREMLRYNKQDVRLLEDVYLRLAPFAPAKFNMALHFSGCCPLCGSDHLNKRGTYQTRTTIWQRYECQECFHWSKSPVGKQERVR